MDCHPNLATCSYSALSEETMGVGIATSVGKPRTWGQRPVINQIAPYGIFNHKPAYDEPTFRRLYDARLAEKAPQIDDAIEALTVRFEGQRLVVLCWCGITHLDDFCHRRMFARWAEARYGIEVPDLALEGPSGPAGPNRAEEAARERKVAKLADAAHEMGVTPQAVATDEAVRKQLVSRAGVRAPSDTTWARLLERLTASFQPRLAV